MAQDAHKPWLPQMERLCLEATLDPSIGGMPAPPLALIGELVAQALHLDGLEIELEGARPAAPALELHENEFTFFLDALPLEGMVAISVSKDAFWELLATDSAASTLRAEADSDIAEGFLMFAAMHIAQALRQAQYPPKCSWTISDEWRGEPALCWPGMLKYSTGQLPFRIEASAELLSALKHIFAKQPLRSLNPQLAALIEVSLDLAIGGAHLTLGELRQLQLGDLLLLDWLEFSGEDGAGTVYLKMGPQTLWSCSLQNKQLETIKPFPTTVEAHTMSFPPDDDLFDDLDEQESFEELELDTPDAEVLTKQASKTKKRSRSKLSADDLDSSQIRLTVSLGRLNIALRELLELTPGAVLELPQSLPAPTVELLVGERCVGRAELVQLEDSLGVRIMEL